MSPRSTLTPSLAHADIAQSPGPAATIQAWLIWLGSATLPRHEARALLRYVTGLSTSQLITRDTELLSAEQAQQLADLAKRRLDGEPLAYLLGEREFFGLPFVVTPAVLIPRADTEVLVQFALEHLPMGGCAIDLGTGSGAIAVSIAVQRPDVQVHASDVSASALACAMDNAQRLVDVTAHPIQFHHGNWFEALPKGLRADLLVSNPPYIPADDPHLAEGDLRFEPTSALTDQHDGLDCLRELIDQAPHWLKPEGWLAVEHGWNQHHAVQSLFQQRGFADVATRQDLEQRPRITFGRWLQSPLSSPPR